MKEMHQSHIHGIFLGWRPKTFDCFIRMICIELAHFIPWSHHHKKSLSLPQILGIIFGAVLHSLPPPWGMRKALERETRGWKNFKKKKRKNHICDHLELSGHLGIGVLQSRVHMSRLSEATKWNTPGLKRSNGKHLLWSLWRERCK